ncbi:MAG: hypothetical protein ACR2OH_06185 [Microthrixaceae bacterium]
MSRRLEIELTSERPDGSWTWRAVGAKQPKGDLSGDLLPDGAKVGSVLRAEAEIEVDGIEITSVLPDKAARKEPELIEILGSGKDEPLVTTQLAPKGKGRGRKGSRGRDGDDRGGRRGGGRGERDRDRGPRPDPVPERPQAKRLRPRRVHRDAALGEVPEEQRPIAEQVLRGGVPAVREEARKQNEAAKKENRPGIPVDQVVAMAEAMVSKLREAEWLDRAEAAKVDLDELDIRDLRSVVVAADPGARTDEARALRDELASGLTRRVEEEHRNWISDMEANLDAGRFVRALRLSSRPPKAGTPLPPALQQRLIDDVSKGLTDRTKQELYAAALDALSFSPVRTKVTPAGKPENPSEELVEAAKRIADKAPAIAELFGVDPKEAGAARKRRKRNRSSDKGAKGGRDSKDGRETRGADNAKRPKDDSKANKRDHKRDHKKKDKAKDFSNAPGARPKTDDAAPSAEDSDSADKADESDKPAEPEVVDSDAPDPDAPVSADTDGLDEAKASEPEGLKATDSETPEDDGAEPAEADSDQTES